MQEGKVFEERYIAYPDGKISKLDGTPLKKYISPYGYERVCINGKYWLVHRIVATVFIPNPDNKPQVNHIDGNKQNNDISNLEWVTPEENMRHASRMGLLRPPQPQDTYRKRKFLDNGKIEVTVYIDKELRDRFKEILRDANMTYSEWFENAIKDEIMGGVCQ